MTKPLRSAIKIISEQIPKPKKVVEVGSRRAIGQEELANIRPLFKKSKFVGIDMEAGLGVDLVNLGEKLPIKDSSADVVLCLETFEHCEQPWKVVEELKRVVSKNGIVIVSVPFNFPIHLHPSDYFRFTPMGIKSFFKEFGSKLVVAISPPFDSEVTLNPRQIIFVGSKSRRPKLFKKIKKSLIQQVYRISVHKPYRHRFQDAFKMIKRAINELSFRQEIKFF